MGQDELWVRLVDEPIAEIVAGIEAHDPELAELVASLERRLAFRTFACIRVGVLLGELLVEHDLSSSASGNWVEELVAEPRNRDAIAAEVKAVAREIAGDPKLSARNSHPDADARQRFRRFLRESLGE